jgi:uncharacterized RDD family membrane protein YckC
MRRAAIYQVVLILIGTIVFLATRRHYGGRHYRSTHRYMTLWPRLFSYISDGAILGTIALARTVTAKIGGGPLLLAWVWVIESVAIWAYTICFNAKFGATIGKMGCRLRIVDARTGRPIGWRQAFLRELIPILAEMGALIRGFVLDASGQRHFNQSPEELHRFFHGWGFWLTEPILLMWILAEITTMLTNKKRRALHDYIAGTVVVRTLADVEPASEKARGGEPIPAF